MKLSKFIDLRGTQGGGVRLFEYIFQLPNYFSVDFTYMNNTVKVHFSEEKNYSDRLDWV